MPLYESVVGFPFPSPLDQAVMSPETPSELLLTSGPLRRTLSSPTTSVGLRRNQALPLPPKYYCSPAKTDSEPPERWMMVVVRREKIRYAVGRLVLIQVG